MQLMDVHFASMAVGVLHIGANKLHYMQAVTFFKLATLEEGLGEY
jgi:hypothetical protein